MERYIRHSGIEITGMTEKLHYREGLEETTDIKVITVKRPFLNLTASLLEK